MAIAVDATSSTSAALTAGTSYSWTHVCSGSELFLVVLLGVIDNTSGRNIISGVTYNGIAMTLLGSVFDLGGSELYNYLYVLTAPATGSHSVTVSLSADLGSSSSVATGASVSFTGVHQSYPYKLPNSVSSGTTNSAAISLSMGDAVSGEDYVVGSTLTHHATITQDAHNTVIVTQSGMGIGGGQGWAAAYRAASSGNSLDWTQNVSDVYSAIGLTVRSSAAVLATPFLANPALTAAGETISSLTIPNVVSNGGVNGLLVFWAIYYDFNGTNEKVISSVSWNSQSLTKMDSFSTVAFSHHIIVELWYLLNPAAATATLTETFSGNLGQIVSGCEVWNLVDQTTPFGTRAKSANTSSVSSPSVTVSSQAGAVVEAVTWADPGTIPGGDAIIPTGFEMWRTESSGSGSGGVGMVKPGAASVVMNWNIDTLTEPYFAMGVGINFGAPASPNVPCDGDGFFPPIGGGWDQNITVFQ